MEIETDCREPGRDCVEITAVTGDPLPLGVKVADGKVNFAVSVPIGSSACLILYRKPFISVFLELVIPTVPFLFLLFFNFFVVFIFLNFLYFPCPFLIYTSIPELLSDIIPQYICHFFDFFFIFILGLLSLFDFVFFTLFKLPSTSYDWNVSSFVKLAII